ncbi:2-amino-4-hydroxy-6-hydroxymethyldihydropteridine diphosphokinase [Hugenholtzia roseola]|uniref:2-amino-4-hydroxy-6- hydroxymethyldihydropteridine diphosphokinase n=1 Tax=Hugenholtzia roseola TaxID=1002 RepID=UPI0004790620|nr:2-amino-4-hydroxy-6-hydroxymethyldihydropteridine diphosphokinase [Hugenholtzia roseola]
MTAKTRVYLLLGSNLGDKRQNLEAARFFLQKEVGFLEAQSAIYETAPWGLEEQPLFYNQLLVLQTELSPQNLLESVLKIEAKIGRERVRKWDRRTIDIDILYFGSHVISEPNLQIPHPLLHQRRFALVPMVALAPDFQHPIFRVSQQELLALCTDKLPLRPILEIIEDL